MKGWVCQSDIAIFNRGSREARFWKKTFARALGRCLRLPIISRDEMNEGYICTAQKGHAELPEDLDNVVSDFFPDSCRFAVGWRINNC